MTINLNSYTTIGTALFVRMDIPYYKATPSATPTQQILRFSEYDQPVVINSETYTPLGGLLSITDTSSDIHAVDGQLTIAVSGIPDSSIAEIINSKIKGSQVQVWRLFFNPTTKQPLDIPGNPTGRFQGIVNNYSLEEDWDMGSTAVSNKIIFTCSSTLSVLRNKLAGRRTNPTDEKLFYPNDVSMDRVPNLANSNFNFGAVIK